MIRRYTKRELQNLRELSKTVTNPKVRRHRKPTKCPVYEQLTFEVTGTTTYGMECRFLVYQRKCLRDAFNYSCGIVYLPPEGSPLTLARYNGPSHRHGDIKYKAHIHMATEDAIADGRRPESLAIETTRYRSIGEAFMCLAQDYKLSGFDQKHYIHNMFNDLSP